MSETYKTAIIGFGKIAHSLGDDPKMARYFDYASHAQVLQDNPRIDWQAIIDPLPEAREKGRGHWRVPNVVPTVEQLPDADKIEIVIFASPPSPRIAQLDAFPALLGVLVEKPVGRTVAEATEFLAACRQRRIKVQVNYWRRGVSALQDLSSGGLKKSVGSPRCLFATYGNGLLNNGSHIIDLIRMLCGEVIAVQAVGDAISGGKLALEGDIQIPFSLTLSDDATAFVGALDFARYREVGLDIWGERGRLALMQESLVQIDWGVVPNRGLEGENEIASDNPLLREVDVSKALLCMYVDLIHAIEEEREPMSSGHSALTNQIVLDAVCASARESGRRIWLRHQ